MITAIIISLLIAWVLDYAQFRIVGFNYSCPFNGLGAIESVCAGTALAPMQYRVAVPWMFRGLRKLSPFADIPTYEVLKILMMAFGLFGVWLLASHVFAPLIGWLSLFMTAIFYVGNFQFDYTEQYLELGLWALFIYALYPTNPILAIIVVIIAVLNRETSILLPVMAGLAGIWGMAILSSILIFMVMLLLRMYYGFKPSYLDEGVKLGGETFRGKNHFPKNLREIKKGLTWFMYPTWYTLLVIVSGIVSVVLTIFPYPLSNVPFVVFLLFILLVFRAMFHEGVRILLPTLSLITPALAVELVKIAI